MTRVPRFVGRLLDGATLSRKVLNRELARVLPALARAERVLDVGGAGGLRYRSLVRSGHYWSVDAALAHRPTIAGDAHALPIQSDSIDLVLSIQVLEHCRYPATAVAELHRVLRPGGTLVLSTVLVYELHGSPHDYYRFTESALRDLAGGFRDVSVVALGNRFTAAYDLTLARSVVLNTLLGKIAFALGTTPAPGCPSGYVLIGRKESR